MYRLIKLYLKKLNYSTKTVDFENSLYSHPNFPSLLAITDSLSTVDIENVAVKVPFKHLAELPKIFLIELDKGNK